MFTNKILIFMVVILIGVLIFRLYSSISERNKQGTKVTVEGYVISEPIAKLNKIQFRLDRYWVTTDYRELSVGDRVKVFGELENVNLKAEEVKVIDQFSLQGEFVRWRQRFVSRINHLLPIRESGLLTGILLGSKDGLSRETRDKLVATGTLHIVVVSGYNIVLVASFFLVTARFIGRKKATFLAVLGIVLYSLLVGLEPPTLRALIMGIISLLAVLLGRQAIAFYSLLLAMYLMLLIDPANLTDVSFQLSVSATLGIIIFTSYFQRAFKRVPGLFREALASTLAAQVLVVPLIYYYFGNVSLLSPAVNSLVLWVIPLATFLGFVFLVISFVSGVVASLASSIVYLPLRYFFVIVDSFSELDFLLIKLDQTSVWEIIGYYLLVLGLVVHFRQSLFKESNLIKDE